MILLLLLLLHATAGKTWANNEMCTIKTQSVIYASLSPKLFVCVTQTLQPKPQKNCFNDKIFFFLFSASPNKKQIKEEEKGSEKTKIFLNPTMGVGVSRVTSIWAFDDLWRHAFLFFFLAFKLFCLPLFAQLFYRSVLELTQILPRP